MIPIEFNLSFLEQSNEKNRKTPLSKGINERCFRGRNKSRKRIEEEDERRERVRVVSESESDGGGEPAEAERLAERVEAEQVEPSASVTLL